jgi:hypothetical protein
MIEHPASETEARLQELVLELKEDYRMCSIRLAALAVLFIGVLGLGLYFVLPGLGKLGDTAEGGNWSVLLSEFGPILSAPPMLGDFLKLRKRLFRLRFYERRLAALSTGDAERQKIQERVAKLYAALEEDDWE